MPPSSLKSLRKLAKAWAKLGLSVIPIRPDASKSPAISSWKKFQERIATPEEIKKHFKDGYGIAILGGEVSGNLEILDFDVPKDENGNVLGECVYEAWLDCLDADLLDLVEKIPVISTPGGGRHLYYRCEELAGNKKLAMKLNPPGTKPPKSTVVETRGRGGYVLAPGCPPECHPTGKTYELVSGSIESVPTITVEQRTALFAAARSFDESGILQKEAQRRDPSLHPATERDGNRPGDDFNRRADWAAILEPHGWTFGFHRRHDGAQCWRRPGKPTNEKGISATIRVFDGMEIFHSFSSNSDPLPHDESITKFTAYTLLNHGGDYEAAARELGKQGYGEPPRRIIDIDVFVDGKRDDSVPWNDAPPGYIETRIVRDNEGEEEPPDLAFDPSPLSQFDESIFHEEMDPLEVQLFEDQEKLEAEEKTRKRKEKLKRRQIEMSKGPAYLVWRDFGDPPRREITDEGRVKTRVDRPRDTAWLILNDNYSSKDGVRTIHYQNEQFMVWNKERYRAFKSDGIRPKLTRSMSHFAEYNGEDEDENPKWEPFKVRDVRVREMVNTFKDMTYLDSEIIDPCWLCDAEEGETLPDPREIVCCKNGLLDIVNRELLPPSPAFYSFNNTGIVYDPEADDPETWLHFLDSSLDKESQLLLQQWMGYCLVQDTRLQKMLMVVGKPGSGKGTAMEILQRLVGKSACCSMHIDKLGEQFALENALGKSLMLFPDARQNAKFDLKGSALSTILSITGEDPIYIDRKHIVSVTKPLNTRIVIVSNDVMQLTDRSKALSRRMLWIKFPGHTGEADPYLKRKLFTELSGILNWAIEGWAMVRSSGGFIQPESADLLRSSFEEQSSDIASFIEDMCVIGTDRVVEKVELVNHWNAWRLSKGYRKMGEAAFGKLLASEVMNLEASRRRVQGFGRRNFYIGIGLDAEKVSDYITEYGGNEKWKGILRMVSGSDDNKSSGEVVTIAEWLDDKKKKE